MLCTVDGGLHWAHGVALATGFLFAVGDVLVRRASKGLSPRANTLVSLLVGTPLLAALAVALGEGLPQGRALALYAAVGVLNFVVGRILFYTAVAGLGAASSAVIVSPVLLIASFMAWLLLGEPLTARLLAGAILVTLAIYLAVSRPSGKPLGGVSRRAAVAAGIAAPLVFAASSVLVRAAGLASDSPVAGALVSYLAALPLVALLSGREVGALLEAAGRGRAYLAYAVGAGAAVTLAQASRYVSLDQLPVAEAVMLISLFPIHTVALAALAGEERVRPRHAAAALLAFTGVALGITG